MKILFQGDSITDAGRDKRNYHDMGNGYPKYAAELIRNAFPEKEIELINLGIGGNRTDQLFDRLYLDGIALEPDVISILIGINDIWHRHGSGRIETTDTQIATNYRAILERIKKQTNAKIVMLSPSCLTTRKRKHGDPSWNRSCLSFAHLPMSLPMLTSRWISCLPRHLKLSPSQNTIRQTECIPTPTVRSLSESIILLPLSR